MSSDDAANKTKIWGIAGAVGVLAFLVLKIALSYTFWGALLLAILIAVLVAIFVWIGFYRDADANGADAPPQRANLASGTMTSGTTGIAAPPTVTEPPVAPPAEASKPAEPAKPVAAPKPKAAKEPTAKKAAALTGDTGSKTVTAKKAAKAKPAKPAAAKPAKKATAAKPAAKAVTADGKPEMLSAARAGGPDDLKQIKGVGPKLEAELHKIGVYHFDQVASWRKKEVAWMDENLAGVRQRVSRDDWVSQAKILAKGGQTEFSKRVSKGDVY